MTTEEFNEYWDNLPEETKENIKELVIARIRQMHDNLRLCLGGRNDLL